jgi:polar amino acid transport system substrate-binding protein
MMNAKKRSILASVVAMASAVAVLFVLSGCSLSIPSVQTNTEVDNQLTPKVSEGATMSKGVLTVGINASNSPYGGTNLDNETVGLDVDVAAALADELGLQLQIVDVNSNGRSAVTNNRVDVALGMTKSGNVNATTYTSAYINDGIALFTLADKAPASLAEVAKQVKDGKAKVLVQTNTAAAYAVQEALGDKATENTDDINAAFKALAEGKQPYLVASAVVGNYVATQYPTVSCYGHIGAEFVTPVYAVTLTENAELTKAVSDAMNTISQNGVLRVIVSKWVGSAGLSLMPGKTDLSTLPDKAFGEAKAAAAAEKPAEQAAQGEQQTNQAVAGDQAAQQQTDQAAAGGQAQGQ